MGVQVHAFAVVAGMAGVARVAGVAVAVQADEQGILHLCPYQDLVHCFRLGGLPKL